MFRRIRRRFADSRILAFLAVLGPGIISASAGNDAGGVATYSQAGAQYGYSLLWVMFLLTFSLGIAQEMGARMAAVTGKGLADLIREEFGVKTTIFAMGSLLIANIATTVAEFAGITAVVEMFAPSSWRFVVVPLVALVVWLLVAQGTYKRVERIFLVMCLVYLAYVAAAFAVRPSPPWASVLLQTILPDFRTVKPDAAYVQMVIALVGTTIAPWMQFYVQSSVRDKGLTTKEYPLERVDVLTGSVLSNLISFFIIVTCAATLFARHFAVSDTFTAAIAASALEPIAGRGAKYLFAIGLFNAAMVGAVAVPLSTAYAVTESLGSESGLGRRVREAPLFIGVFTVVIIVAALIILLVSQGALLNVILIAQVINGFLLPVVLVLMLRLVNKKRLMGEFTNGRAYNAVAWATVGVVSVLSVVYLGQTIMQMVRPASASASTNRVVKVASARPFDSTRLRSLQ
jgi:NRAMP (natural resistance-associated macrophage protein)-like metal ion transporter